MTFLHQLHKYVRRGLFFAVLGYLGGITAHGSDVDTVSVQKNNAAVVALGAYAPFCYSTSPLKPENEQKVCSIMQMVGMTNDVSAIRRFGPYERTQFAFAFVVKSLNGNTYLYVDEDIFEKMDEKQQHAVIAHELMHVRLHHLDQQHTLNEFNSQDMAISREREKAADLAAVSCLKTASGAIALWENWLAKYPGLNRPTNSLDSHPALPERIAYLKNAQLSFA